MRLSLGAWIVLLSASVLAAGQYRALWLDAFRDGYKNPQQIDRLLDDMQRARCNAVFVEVRHRGGTYYLRSLEPPVEDATWSKGFDVLDYLIEKAHSKGIEVHAWYPVYPLWPLARPPLDPQHLWHRHGPGAAGAEMWMNVAADGRIGVSLDPGHPEAMRYLADLFVDPLRHYALDGIHLDYIRYPEDADYGYNPRAVARYMRLHNAVSAPAPGQASWSDFRRRQVTELVRQTYLRAVATRPQVKVSAALISWGNGPASDAAFLSTDAYRRVFQDWRSWQDEGIVDIGMPMHYFREAANASFLTNWLEFSKDRAYRRAVVPGLGAYLNPIAATMEQLRRTAAPSRRGNAPAGVAFYSYATTNLQGANGLPLEPNAAFYEALGAAFREDAAVPELPWKLAPVTGHLMGRLTVSGSSWLADGATVRVESDGAATTVSRELTTDGSGFFGAVDLPPGRYSVRVHRGGQEIFRTAAQEVEPGRVAQFELTLRAEDFDSVLPRLFLPDAPAEAAPGDWIVLRGTRLAPGYAPASAVPLPLALAGTQVLVNGAPAPLLAVAEGGVEFLLPFRAPPQFEILVRANGLDSNPVHLEQVPARPVIQGVRRSGAALEIFATGLGPLSPQLAPGSGADPAAGLPVTTEPVQVRFLQASGPAYDMQPFYSGAAPWLPGRYQVNAIIPAEFPATSVQLIVSGRISAVWPLP